METKREITRILVGNNHFVNLGGSELFAYDLIRELGRRPNIEVEYFAIERGAFAEKMERETGVRFKTNERYDLIIAAHTTTIEHLFRSGVRGRIVQVCHSKTITMELPSIYADYHVGISQEICDRLDSKGFPNQLVLNGLDLEQKRPITQPNERLRKVLSLCQNEEANTMLQHVCTRLGLEFASFNKHKNPSFTIEQEINKADLVVGIGRSIYDAMACGRPCVVFDSRDYNGNKGDGYLHPDLFDAYVQTNCSGRFRNHVYTADELLSEFEKYNAEDGKRLRQIAEERLTVVKSADALLNVVNCISWDVVRKKKRRIFSAEFKRFRKSFKRELKKMIGIRVDR